ncbi:MAG: hypothetical protein OXI12_11195 [Gammaproteobacteria bacterium]|nr:hypothetical protein [Gammaproteobacteria bacterium]
MGTASKLRHALEVIAVGALVGGLEEADTIDFGNLFANSELSGLAAGVIALVLAAAIKWAKATEASLETPAS